MDEVLLFSRSYTMLKSESNVIPIQGGM